MQANRDKEQELGRLHAELVAALREAGRTNTAMEAHVRDLDALLAETSPLFPNLHHGALSDIEFSDTEESGMEESEIKEEFDMEGEEKIGESEEEDSDVALSNL